VHSMDSTDSDGRCCNRQEEDTTVEATLDLGVAEF